MSTRILVVLALSAAMPVWAQQQADAYRELEEGSVRQLSTTQAHLREMQPPETASRATAPVLARLLGKVLSEQIKGVTVELDATPTPAESASLQDQSQLRLNRRAEICFDNYRVGIKRGGVMMRYDLSF